MLAAAAANGISLAITTTVARELECSDISTEQYEVILESGVFGESRWGRARWASSGSAATMERVLEVIANGSFPTAPNRSSLTPAQRRQLRDAMIFSAHVTEGRDIFVTKDSTGFVNHGRREVLESEFRTKILTPREFLVRFPS